MNGETSKFCNYCEGQAFEKGRCVGCGASSWKNGNASKQIFPSQQHTANDRDFSEAHQPAKNSTFFDLIISSFHFVENLVSTVKTIIKYKLVFFFSCIALMVIASVITSPSGEKKNTLSESEFPSKHSQEQLLAESSRISKAHRMQPMVLKAPTPKIFTHNKLDSVPFPVQETRWGAHFNPTQSVPDEGFLAFYFNSSNPAQQAQPVQVKNVGIKYSYNDFQGIPSNHFGAYWVGTITIHEPETIEVIATKGWNEFRIIIDGSIVQEHSRRSEPTKLVKIGRSQQSTNRVLDKKKIVFAQSVYKEYPKSPAGNPLVTLTSGDHLIEIELLNNWHTTEFNAQFKRAQPE